MASLPFSDTTDRNPAILYDIMRLQGKHPSQLTPPIDWGVRMPKPQTERELSVDDILGMFDRKEALYMVYVPHFVTQCVMWYADKLCNYARRNRLKQFRPYTSVLWAMRDEYIEALHHEMPDDVFDRYLAQRKEYLSEVEGLLQKTYYTFLNEQMRLFGEIDRAPIYCYANIIEWLVMGVKLHDSTVNAIISRRVGKPVRSHPDERLEEILGACARLAKDYQLGDNQQAEIALRAIFNTAKKKINEMYEQEHSEK